MTVGLEILVPIFLAISFVYASVGMGGGSAYVATMAIAGMDHRTVPPLALSLNLVVATGGFVHYLRAGFFQSRLFVPLVVTSVPAAFLASTVPLDRQTFQLMLGGCLLVASLRLLGSRFLPEVRRTRDPGPWRLVLFPVLGLLLGATAGLTGIGGGIYLAPALLLARLANAKEAAAVAAGFIVVNSVAGLAGRFLTGPLPPFDLFAPLAATVLIGGQLGAFVGARHYRMSTVETIFGAIMAAIAIRLLGSGYA